jgi:hypothetical protein
VGFSFQQRWKVQYRMTQNCELDSKLEQTCYWLQEEAERAEVTGQVELFMLLDSAADKLREACKLLNQH